MVEAKRFAQPATTGTFLAKLEAAGLRRRLRVFDRSVGPRVMAEGSIVTLFSTNDYLGLSRHPAVVGGAQMALAGHGAGAGASRLISGTSRLHAALERRLAGFKGTEAALVFPTGYMAGVGIVTALAGKGDAVVLDRLCHASLIDGARLSGARLLVYDHADPDALDRVLAREIRRRAGRVVVVTESVFSMDGDVAPLAEIAAVCARRGASLVADEAHATGVFGERGCGVAEAAGVHDGITVSMGTLSKALGGQGGFAAGSRAIIDLLVNVSRPFIFTTALAPAACGAAAAALNVIETQPVLRVRLWENIRHLAEGLARAGLSPGLPHVRWGASPIFPLVVGGAARTVAVAGRLWDSGFYVPAIRPPTVPEGTSRLRISVTARHEREDLDRLVAALGAALKTRGPAGARARTSG